MGELGSFIGREDGKHNGVGFVEISDISATSDDFVLGTESFDSLPCAGSI